MAQNARISAVIQANVNTAQANWTQVTISNIVVTNGQCDIGVYSNASGGQWIDFDDWELVQTGSSSGPTAYQAESGTVAGGAVVASNHSGYTGTGFVDFPANGGTVTLSNVNGNGGGTKSLAIRYANGNSGGNSRTGNLTVNGTTVPVTFPATSAWDVWATFNVNVTLNNNSTNTIQLASTGQDLANIDQITVP